MYSHSSRPSLPLLYIDDSPEDRLLVDQAICRTNARFTLFTAHDPQSAAPYFQYHPLNGGPDPHPRPALVLLDYDMGIYTGADFLIWLRIQKQIATTPVVMYSGSVGASHVEECYALGATHFLRKSQTLSGIERIIRTLAVCMQLSPPRFGPLTSLPEYEAVPLEDTDLKLKTCGACIP